MGYQKDEESSVQELTPEALCLGEKLFKKTCVFIAGVQNKESFLPELLPEVAFVGRSNVGKSSLLNGLTGRRSLARTSSTPGRTQQLNFFNLGDQVYLVDLPGYGYAAASKEKIAHWNELVQFYLCDRRTLLRVFLLVDGRHGLKPVDIEFANFLDKIPVSYQVILTKVDKISDRELKKRIEDIEIELKKHPAAYPLVLSTSVAKKEGLEKLRALVISLLK